MDRNLVLIAKSYRRVFATASTAAVDMYCQDSGKKGFAVRQRELDALNAHIDAAHAVALALGLDDSFVAAPGNRKMRRFALAESMGATRPDIAELVKLAPSNVKDANSLAVQVSNWAIGLAFKRGIIVPPAPELKPTVTVPKKGRSKKENKAVIAAALLAAQSSVQVSK